MNGLFGDFPMGGLEPRSLIDVPFEFRLEAVAGVIVLKDVVDFRSATVINTEFIEQEAHADHDRSFYCCGYV
jgi:hypothetical protein